jgi:DNA-binding MarR family transcriptional regulator
MAAAQGRDALPDAPWSSDMTHHAHAEAVAALHLTGLRRQFEAIRDIFGPHPPHCAREALWVALEVLLAHLRAERITQRDLVVRADGLLSAPTLSRVVVALERQGLVTSELAPGHARLKVLHPTERALDILTARAEEALGEFAEVMASLERRLTNATEQPDNVSQPDRRLDPADHRPGCPGSDHAKTSPGSGTASSPPNSVRD